MNVSITPELQLMVQQQVESGRYNNASEVVRAALRLFERHEIEERAHREHLREVIESSLADIEAGRTVPAEDVLTELNRMIEDSERADDVNPGSAAAS